MKPNIFLNTDPRSLPDNANLPTINQPETIRGVSISFLSLALLAISLRLWVRFRDDLWGWDDLLVFLSGVSSVIGDTMVCLMPEDGLGLHLWTLDGERIISFFRHTYGANATYCASSTLIKLSILFQYLRLFSDTASSTTTAKYRLARRLTWTLIVLTTVWGLTFFLLALFSCNPIAKYWQPYLAGMCIGWGTKVPEKFFPMYLSHSVTNMLLDLLVLTLPIPFLRMLRLAGKSKAGLITLFSLGCIIGGLAVGRMIALSFNRIGTIPVMDMTYYTPFIFIFGVLEINVAIIAASVPIFWPVIVTLAANKIFVLNEVDVHVEEAPRSSFGSGPAIGLADQGTWSKDNVGDAFGGRTDEISIMPKTYDRTPHRHKPSISSLRGRTIAMDFGHRSSQESQRCLHRTASTENANSPGGESDDYDWFLELNKEIAGGWTTTTVERAKVPVEHIKAFDSRQGPS
ncbi:hypothetical protein BKA66DRAFT_408770 [Pyrenochaeta sp. MPI-SDFR-AT-0127]|nr:hypothetical protein BKA66DRAFT_408770 [Pyrenochaeta sp. MPI-SDFR-AT-0127]